MAPWGDVFLKLFFENFKCSNIYGISYGICCGIHRGIGIGYGISYGIDYGIGIGYGMTVASALDMTSALH